MPLLCVVAESDWEQRYIYFSVQAHMSLDSCVTLWVCGCVVTSAFGGHLWHWRWKKKVVLNACRCWCLKWLRRGKGWIPISETWCRNEVLGKVVWKVGSCLPSVLSDSALSLGCVPKNSSAPSSSRPVLQADTAQQRKSRAGVCNTSHKRTPKPRIFFFFFFFSLGGFLSLMSFVCFTILYFSLIRALFAVSLWSRVNSWYPQQPATIRTCCMQTSVHFGPCSVPALFGSPWFM